MTHPTLVPLAGLLAVVLRQVIAAIDARQDWTPEQRRQIPLVCAGLSVVLSLLCYVSGLPVDESAVMGGGALGAVVVHELASARKVSQ